MQMTRGTTVYQFTYDANGTPMTISENGTVYYYVTNLQGDVMAILNSGGTEVVRYSYNAWGKKRNISGTMASTLGTYNPLRYRGYVYDQETDLYYLQSRYYNPAIGRFINADAFASTGDGVMGNNMFAYCGNNPVTRIDQKGESFAVVLGINLNFFGWGVTGSINLVSTDKNFGIQCSYYSSFDKKLSEKENQTMGIDIGPYVGIQCTEKDDMKDLEGLAKATGGDVVLGMDALTDENGGYLGWQFGASLLSANMHSLYTDTITLFSVPTFDLPGIIVDWIFGDV